MNLDAIPMEIAQSKSIDSVDTPQPQPTPLPETESAGNISISDAHRTNIPQTDSTEAKIKHHVQHSSVIMDFVMTERELARAQRSPSQRRASLQGSDENQKTFWIFISIMTFCGSNNDFLGKLCYQSLPELADNRYWYWRSWLLTVCTFFSCIFALFFGWKSEWIKLKSLPKAKKSRFWRYLFYAGTSDVLVNLGRYIGLLFLPASVTTELKYGAQLLFSAASRIWFEHKTFSRMQGGGLLLVMLGLILVIIQSFLDHTNENGDHGESVNLTAMGIGVVILFASGCFGSVRNSFEQVLCRDKGYKENFVIGIRSVVSLIWMVVIALILLSFPIYDTTNKTGWNSETLYNGAIGYIFQFPVFLTFLILFMFAIYGKNVAQLKVIKLSSALTRNLTMQFTPILTWIFSLIFYYTISHNLGEAWTTYAPVRLAGFICVIVGSYCYMHVPSVPISDEDKMTEMQLDKQIDPKLASRA